MYLERIAHRGPVVPNATTLAAVHRAHMLSIPFENLDITLGTPIELSLPALYDKIVVRRRGGFCYELNGLFGWLLTELGFDVVTLSGRVFNEGALGPEFDHMLLVVRLEDRWIADVGFGDSFLEPFPMHQEEHVEGHRAYRVAETERALVLERHTPEADWEPQYAFTGAPRRLADFEAMCRYQQTSPRSAFTRKSVCSLPTEEGRITLSNGRFIVSEGAKREERRVSGPVDYRGLLRQHFGFDLPEGADIERLLAGGGGS